MIFNPHAAKYHQPVTYTTTADLAAGDIVIWGNRPHRVVAILERQHVDWDEKYLTPWDNAGRPDPATWRHRPLGIDLRNDFEPDDAKPIHLMGPASAGWSVLPEHYLVCRTCTELPPCEHVRTEAAVQQAVKQMEADMAILPGCCHGCGEPITARQKAVVFEGPNLIRPDLGDATAVFHARRSCSPSAFHYDEKWAAADPGRRRKLYCEGLLRCHYDGTTDCSLAGLCPSPDVMHQSAESHDPAYPSYASGCWCVSGDLTTRLSATDGRMKP